uniref:Uncharacterized protein n=1 Tax=Romanomermis culicivorax TaxID=13658 RepID=A0A915K3D2_ROMCU
MKKIEICEKLKIKEKEKEERKKVEFCKKKYLFFNSLRKFLQEMSHFYATIIQKNQRFRNKILKKKFLIQKPPKILPYL